MARVVQLVEYAAAGTPLQVDAENGVIRGVKVLGLQSQNGRRYLKEAVGKAAPLYEGRVVNIDHPNRAGEQVPVSRRFGWLESVTQHQDGSLWADLHYLTSHPAAPAVVEAARRNPKLLGLSHNARGREVRRAGENVIEAIEAVNSVDLVADPATVAGLFESRSPRMKLKDLIESLKATRPGYAKGLREAAEAGLMSPDAEMDAPPPMDEPDEGGDHEQALKDAAKAVIDDDSLSWPEKIAKITKIGGIIDDDGGEGGGSDEPAGESEAKEESRRLKLENHGLKLLMEHGMKPTKALAKAFTACKSEAEVKELVEDARSSGHYPRQGARSSGTAPITEARKNGKAAEVPSDGKALGRYLRD